MCTVWCQNISHALPCLVNVHCENRPWDNPRLHMQTRSFNKTVTQLEHQAQRTGADLAQSKAACHRNQTALAGELAALKAAAGAGVQGSPRPGRLGLNATPVDLAELVAREVRDGARAERRGTAREARPAAGCLG